MSPVSDGKWTNMPLESLALFAILGLLAGSLSGLLGIGGGVLLVPALVFGFGLTEHMAQGTTLALMVPPIGLLAAIAYKRQNFIHMRIAGLVCLGFMGGAYLGAQLAVALPNLLLERVFGAAVLLIALKMILSQDHELAGTDAKDVTRHKDGFTFVSISMFLLLGLVVGAASGLIGIGGGVLLVPALVFIFGLSQHEAQGTTLALMVPPIGFPAAWEYYQQGDVNITIAVLICAGFFFGALLGARLATCLSSRWLGRVFGIALIPIAIKMLLGV